MKIGRIEVSCPFDPVEIGDTVTFSFWVGDDLEPLDALARCEYLRNLTAGEPVIVQHDDDERLSGAYRVVSVVLEPSAVYLTNGHVVGEITLTRLGRHFSHPTVALVCESVPRSTSTHSVTPAIAPYFPSDALGASNWLLNVQTTINGGRVSQVADLSSGDVFEASVPLHQFYDGAPVVEVQGRDGVWRDMGGSIPAGTAPGAVRISNGVTRWRWEGVALKASLVAASGAGWGAEQTVVVTHYDPPLASVDTVVVESVRVARRSLTEIVLECVALDDSSIGGRRVVWNMTLARGERFVTLDFAASDTRGFMSSESWASLTGGASSTSFVFGCAEAVTVSTNTVEVTSGSVMFGMIEWSGTWSAASLIADWWSGVSTRQRFVT